MGLVVTYYMPADATSGPWTEDLSDNVRLGTISGIVDEAELGAVGISSLLFDDPDATLGTSHYPDGIRGLKRIWIDETSCPSGDQRLFTGWIGDRRYRRGTDSLIVGVARKLDATLVDSNTMLSFRVFAPVNGSNSTAYNASNSFIRPAETDLERVAALLTVPFLTSVHDTGFISTGAGVDMDACDYTGQHPSDVLNDCAQQSGRNFYIRYDETANEFSLHYVDDGDLTDAATLRISNVLADVDYVTTFPPEPDAELVRDPSRVSAAVYLPFNGSNSPAYQTRIQTEYDYGWRDSSAPSSNVKTLTAANVRASRYLLTTSTEDDRITCTVKLPANVVTGIKQGQVVQAKFSHMPNGSNATWGSAFQWCRVLNRNVMANEQTNVLYNVRYELSPIAPTPNLYAELQDNQSYSPSCEPIGTVADTWYEVGWRGNGDAPAPGYGNHFKSGPVDYVAYPCSDIGTWGGLELSADATVSLTSGGDFIGVDLGGMATVTVEILQNSTPIASQTVYAHDTNQVNLSVSGISALSGDIFTTWWKFNDWTSYPYYRQGPGDYTRFFTITA